MPSSNSYIAILDVGHGNCTVIFERGTSCIVDCGAGSSVLEFIAEEGITTIENIFLSHADQDHIEGLVALLASDLITIHNVYVNSDGVQRSALWDDLSYALSKSSAQGGTKFNTAITRTQGEFKCGEIIIETIGPSAYLAAKSPGGKDRKGRKITSNSISASFRIFWQGNPVVYLAGDIDAISLYDLQDHDVEIKAPLLVFPHHGGHISSGNVIDFAIDLCDMVAPETVVFSIGRSRNSNPLPDVVKTIREKIKNVRIACTQLSKNCAAILNDTIPVHLHSVFSKGRAANECCSGTFMIDLADSVIYTPDLKSHQVFIAAEATTPICIN